MRNLTTILLRIVLVAVSVAVAPACTRAQAKVTPVEPPSLDVPAPPPRLVEPAMAEAAPAVETVEQPAPSDQADTKTNAPTPRRAGPVRTAEAPRPETPPAEAAKPVESPPRAQSPPLLQTIPAGKEDEVERSIRAQLARASGNLNRVDYRQLSDDGRANYDQAKRFISQAEEALHDKNLVFAATVAEKANTLAAQLASQ